MDDLCPTIPGTALHKGCPSISNDSSCEDTNIAPLCGNGVIDEGEDCRNCPEDVGMCSSICGNGIVEP